MTTTYDLQAVSGGSPDIARDRWQRPLVVPPEGGKPVAYTRCTTFVGSIDDTIGLMQWKQRQTALGLVARDDLRLRVASLGPQPDDDEKAVKDWKARLNKVVDDAMEAAGSSSAATIGTALHSFSEAVDRGEKVKVPAEYAAHLDNYKRQTAGFETVHIERFLVQDKYRIGGTADRIYRDTATGRMVIGDLKTGNVEYPHKIAMQLAVYANSLIYDTQTHERTPLDVDVERAVIVHLDAKTGDCRLLWVDIKAGWEAVGLAAEVRKWRDRKNLTSPVNDHTQTVETVAKIVRPTKADKAAEQALRQCATRPELMITADSLKGAGAWSDDLNKLAGQLWSALPAA